MNNTHITNKNNIEGRRRMYESKVDRAFEVEPSDENYLIHDTIAIYVGGPGDIKLELYSGDIINLHNLTPGAWHPIVARKIYNTGTTCTNIVGAY